MNDTVRLRNEERVNSLHTVRVLHMYSMCKHSGQFRACIHKLLRRMGHTHFLIIMAVLSTVEGHIMAMEPFGVMCQVVHWYSLYVCALVFHSVYIVYEYAIQLDTNTMKNT